MKELEDDLEDLRGCVDSSASSSASLTFHSCSLLLRQVDEFNSADATKPRQLQRMQTQVDETMHMMQLTVRYRSSFRVGR